MHVEAEPAPLVGQLRGRALGALAVVEVLPHAHVAGAQRLRQHAARRTPSASSAANARSKRTITSSSAPSSAISAARRLSAESRTRCTLRPQNGDRRRMERHHGRRAGRARRPSATACADHGPMAEVDAVEAAERDRPLARRHIPPGSGARSQHHHRLQALAARLGHRAQLAAGEQAGGPVLAVPPQRAAVGDVALLGVVERPRGRCGSASAAERYQRPNGSAATSSGVPASATSKRPTCVRRSSRQ